MTFCTGRLSLQTHRPLLLASAMLILAALMSSGSNGASVPPTIDYNRDIWPILSENCFSCHGFDEKHRKAKLRLVCQTRPIRSAMEHLRSSRAI